MKSAIIILASLLTVGCTKHGPIFIDSATAVTKEISNSKDCRAVIQTQTGRVVGVAEDEAKVCSWRGIPYAKPPVGDLRWRAPQAAAPWEDILDAQYWGGNCQQKTDFMTQVMNKNPAKHQSEDCLNLNIWRPQKTGNFPVMVWFHGGGLGMGSANTPMYWGDRLSEAGDVVFVSVNYRLGRLGFLALPALKEEDPNGTVGNYGILDQIQALKWIQENISAFGGNPDNITIFGESGGSWSVCSLLTSPLAGGLFHKAIMQSGACDQTEELEDGFATGIEFSTKHDCKPDDLACLRRLPAEDIVEKQPDPSFLKYTYGPHIDGYAFVEKPLSAIRAGRHNSVPVIAGFTRDEMSMFAPMIAEKITELPKEHYQTGIEQMFACDKKTAKAIEALYPLSKFAKPESAYAAMASDAGFICPTLRVARLLSENNNDTWVYRFDYTNFRFGKKYGAIHALEIPLVLQTLGRKPFNLFYSHSQRRKARALSEEMSRRWLAFARQGQPTYEDSRTEWEPYNNNDGKIFIFGGTPRSNTNPDYRDICEFWDSRSELSGTW